MEVIKERRGRESAGKRVSRPVTVRYRYRAEPILAEGTPGRAKEAALTALAVFMFTGIGPALLANLLIWLLEPVPDWAFLTGFCALLLGGAAWVWRVL